MLSGKCPNGNNIKLHGILKKGVKLRVNQVTKGIHKRVDIIGLACNASVEVLQVARAKACQPLGS